IILKNESANREIVYDSIALKRMKAMFFPRAPRVEGHEFIPRGIRAAEVDGTNGTSLKNNSIKIYVSLIDSDSSEFQSRFRVSLRIQVVRNLTFKVSSANGKVDENLRVKYMME